MPRIYTLLTADQQQAPSPPSRATRELPWCGSVRFARTTRWPLRRWILPVSCVLPADLTCFRPLLGSRRSRRVHRARLRRSVAVGGGRGRAAGRVAVGSGAMGAGTLAVVHRGVRGRGCRRAGKGCDDINSLSLPVPDAAGVLTPSSELRFNDAPGWRLTTAFDSRTPSYLSRRRRRWGCVHFVSRCWRNHRRTSACSFTAPPRLSVSTRR